MQRWWPGRKRCAEEVVPDTYIGGIGARHRFWRLWPDLVVSDTDASLLEAPLSIEQTAEL